MLEGAVECCVCRVACCHRSLVWAVNGGVPGGVPGTGLRTFDYTPNAARIPRYVAFDSTPIRQLPLRIG
jgi:hypothetical protein